MKRKYRVIATLTVVTILLALGLLMLKDVYSYKETYKDNLIRFHVIANSDSKEDQELKIKVRDKIISEMNDKFESSSSIEESRKTIVENIDKIQYIAKQEIKNNGRDYDVNVYFGNFKFPTKSYGSFTLPAGEYEALRVVIGEGKGKNWWCVMFPPLCFIDVTHGVTSKKAEEELKELLTEEEFESIKTAKSGDEVPIKLRFKIVELIEEGRMRFAKLFMSSR